jgi:osmotically-inducible protein OsmY
MASDREIQERVLRALDSDPVLTPASVGVLVTGGIVTLVGPVGTLQERWAAERIAERVPGVRAIANDLQVGGSARSVGTSSVIAEEVARALASTSGVPPGAVTPTVWDGWVTLAGTVDREHQKHAAERAVGHIAGVKEVFNAITVREPDIAAPRVSPANEVLALAR